MTALKRQPLPYYLAWILLWVLFHRVYIPEPWWLFLFGLLGPEPQLLPPILSLFVDLPSDVRLLAEGVLLTCLAAGLVLHAFDLEPAERDWVPSR